ncbi:MAG: hypothetical protein ACOX7B_07900 [Christensenellales bacterium]|jgi:hypothetical protein
MKRSNPMFVAWIVFLVFLILCRAALIWTGMLKGKPVPRFSQHPVQAMHLWDACYAA